MIAFGGDQSRLATRDRSIVDSRLRTQSSLDRRTRSKSKSGSSELPQNSLEDHSSMKLSILVGESTCWPSVFFLRVKRPRPITNYARVHTEGKRNGWHERCNGVWTGRNGTEASPFLTPTVHVAVRVLHSSAIMITLGISIGLIMGSIICNEYRC